MPGNTEIVPMQPGDIVIYQNALGEPEVECVFHGENMWLTQAQMIDLYQVSKSSISEHLKHIFEEGELDEDSVVRKFRTTAADGKDYDTNYYALEAVLAVGYRVRGNRGTQFRQWATAQLKEYLQKGFNLNDKALKDFGGGAYWRELLDRIRDIRSSEKVLYRQVLDVYATAIDYDPSAEESRKFFKIVQNKLHFAAHGHTAAEVIYERADADDTFMGLRTFSGEQVTLADARIAKNYLDEEELAMLNRLVSGYFDLAEARAKRHVPTYMADYVEQLDMVLQATTGRPALQGAGSVSHTTAMQKAEEEYRKYEQRTLSPVELAYLDSLKETQRLLEKKGD